MKLKAVSGIMLSLLLIGIFTLVLNVTIIESESATIIVPDDHEKIQWAIGNASEGDTIFVRAGTYYEHVVVKKTVSIVGENKSTTIIDGNNSGDVFYIKANNVVVTGFTVQNSGLTDSDSGVYVSGTSNVTIIDNLVHKNRYGVSLRYSSSIVCKGNVVWNNEYGIRLHASTNSTLRNNNITDNQYNFYLSGYSPSHFVNDVDISNKVNDKPIHYLVNRSNLIINPLTYPDIGYLGIANSVNVTVQGVNLIRNAPGLLLAYTNNSIITQTSISHSLEGIVLHRSFNNIIIDNNAFSNRWAGLKLEWSSNNTINSNNLTSNGSGIVSQDTSHNYITNNTIENNTSNGISLINGDGVGGNRIIGNNIKGNYNGINSYDVQERLPNIFYYNNFINNNRQVIYYYPGYVDTWDDGYPSGGNYWSDYEGRYPNATEINSSGIWDTPYTINENNQDNYPLMEVIPEYPSFLILSLFILTTLATVVYVERRKRELND